MSESAKKRTRRSPEELVAEIDNKIAAHEEAVKKLKKRKADILNPKPRLSKAQKMKRVIDKAKESGMTIDEIAEKLGVSLE